MPELPEVETVVRSLAPALVGRTIREAYFPAPRVLRDSPETRAERLSGAVIQAIERIGKNILFRLQDGVLVIHLGMTGKLLLNTTPGPYARAVFTLDQGNLVYDDVRQFGRVEWSRDLPNRLAKLGPEPLDLPFPSFWERLRRRQGRIKPLLLNQAFVRGIGNIYADEALFRAGIHPRTETHRIGRQRAQRLHAAVVEVLRHAIEQRGSSISDYVDALGQKGTFQQSHQVYGREGEPCRVCGQPIRRIVLGQRGTHFCPRCQRG